VVTANLDPWLLICLVAALLLSTAVGAERELRQKSAGLRTHTLVGIGAALFTVVSKFGFFDVLQPGLIVLDPSRMAAQIVSGIGFVGAGVVFVQRNKVRGLTTAASIWLVAAIGSAAGAGLLVPAVAATAGYFIVVLGYPLLAPRLGLGGPRAHVVRVSYEDATGALRRILAGCTEMGLAVQAFEVRTLGEDWATPAQRISPAEDAGTGRRAVVEVELDLQGPAPPERIIDTLSTVAGVYSVSVDDED
jgi:putative Mg2+ transporter-C (MgtC) family protein